MTGLAVAAAALSVLALAACVWRLMDHYPGAHTRLPEIRPAVLTALPLAAIALTLLALT